MKLQRNANAVSVSFISQRKVSIAVQSYILIALPLIGFFVFSIYPILWTFRWSFYSYNGIASATRFIGFDNFITMFTTDFTYFKLWGNTFLFAACKIPFELSLALVLAVLLSQRIRGSSFFRSIFYLPSVISTAIIGLIFYNLFGYFGNINAILLKLGFIKTEIDWFASKNTSVAVIVLASIWNTFGINVMYFMAALTNVPKELYESAELDGATRIRMFFNITLPMIIQVFQVILLLSIVGTLGINDIILVLTGGGPGGQTFSVMSYLTKQFMPGFMDTSTPSLGYGCAMSVVTTIMFAIVAGLYNIFSTKIKNRY